MKNVLRSKRQLINKFSISCFINKGRDKIIFKWITMHEKTDQKIVIIRRKNKNDDKTGNIN